MLSFASLPAAADERGNAFLSLRLIGALADINDISTTGFTGSTSIDNDSDEVAGGALVVGYKFKKIPGRVAVEVGHRFRFDLDVRDRAGGTVIDYEMNVATTSAIASIVFEMRNKSNFTPFIGGSLGWARNWTNTLRTNLNTQAKVEKDEVADNFAWGGSVGVDWDFAEHWFAEFAYRYMNLGEVDTGVVGGGRIVGDEYVSHDVLLSVGYVF